jgi:hypothetical protein
MSRRQSSRPPTTVKKHPPSRRLPNSPSSHGIRGDSLSQSGLRRSDPSESEFLRVRSTSSGPPSVVTHWPTVAMRRVARSHLTRSLRSPEAGTGIERGGRLTSDFLRNVVDDPRASQTEKCITHPLVEPPRIPSRLQVVGHHCLPTHVTRDRGRTLQYQDASSGRYQLPLVPPCSETCDKRKGEPDPLSRTPDLRR